MTDQSAANTPSDHGTPDPDLDMLLARINSLAAGETPPPLDPADPSELPAIPRMAADTPGPPNSAASQEISPAVPAPTLDDVQAYVAERRGPAQSGPQHEDILEDNFVPRRPDSFEEARITSAEVEELVLKFLLVRGEASGRQIAEQVRLPFILLQKFLARLKSERLLAYVGQAAMNDYICRLTEPGAVRAHNYSNVCTYFGSAPVVMKDYLRCVKAQSIEGQYPTREQLQEAFSDLLIDEQMLQRLGPAISSGRGMFLYGFPGNGKTSIAERVTKSFGPCIWIPRALSIDGEIVRLYDPTVHEEAPLQNSDQILDNKEVDQRWVRIKRPTIVVGGELTMDHLEITFDKDSGISEAPVQLKSNCGILVIDDFGRQKMRVDELLNRWIVPLEKRYDYLNLSSGKKVQVPFDQLVIFSTNLEPRDLVDDAFMRRIPYKIEVCDPTREMFVKLFQIMARVLNVPYEEAMVEYLIETHYMPTNRPFRNCQPRDLLLQIRNYCNYNRLPVTMTEESVDFAADCYFSVL
jgi:hypothetical protein